MNEGIVSFDYTSCSKHRTIRAHIKNGKSFDMFRWSCFIILIKSSSPTPRNALTLSYRSKSKQSYNPTSSLNLQVLLRSATPPLLVYKICADHHHLNGKRNSEKAHPAESVLLNDRFHYIGNIFVVVFEPAMHLPDDILIVFRFKISENVHARTFNPLGKSHVMRRPVIDRCETGHEFVVPVFGKLVDRFDCGVDRGDMMCDVLNTVMEVGEPVILRFDIGS